MATGKALPGIVSALALATASLMATAYADDPPEPAPHRVKYTVTSGQPTRADIYYLDTEPPRFDMWSHNPHDWMLNTKADVGPNQPWVFELMLNNPDQWATVTVSTGKFYNQTLTPMFHCDLTVDGVVVVSKDGPRGVLCSIRSW
ncbi:MAG: hypothetical protein ACRDTN_06830 [Mycobacterium sp.]